MSRAVRSELLKIRTTNLWWLMGLGIFATVLLALAVNILNAVFTLHPPTEGMDAETKQQMLAAAEHARSAAGQAETAANLYTSGQFFGVLFVMLLGALVITNEYFHQTATATFLATPRRTVVVVAKLIAGVCLAVAIWLATTVLDVIAGVIAFPMMGIGNSLGAWEPTRSILLNLAAYAVWAVLGVGLGALIRSQVAAVVLGTVLYLLSLPAQIIFELIRHFLIKEDWVLTTQVIMPAFASLVMTTPGGKAFDHAPPQWVGAAVLIGYGVVAGLIGTMIIRRRDIA